MNPDFLMGFYDGMEKLALTENQDWAVKGGVAGGGIGAWKYHLRNKAHRKKSIFTRELSSIFKKSPYSLKRGAIGGALLGAAGAYVLSRGIRGY